MTNLTKEFKLSIAKRYMNEAISYRILANQVNVDESIVRYWVMLFRHHGDKAFNFPYTNYSSSFKLKVLKFMNETNYSIREASAIFHIPDPSMVRRWRKQWETAGDKVFESKRKGLPAVTSRDKREAASTNNSNQSRESMEKELEYLRMENAYLKKLRALVQEQKSPKKSKRK